MTRKYSSFITYDKEGKRHSFNDRPAVVHSYGTKNWYKNGRLHRDNNPTVIYSDGTKLWYFDGSFLRETDNDQKIFKIYNA